MGVVRRMVFDKNKRFLSTNSRNYTTEWNRYTIGELHTYHNNRLSRGNFNYSVKHCLQYACGVLDQTHLQNELQFQHTVPFRLIKIYSNRSTIATMGPSVQR